MAPTDTEERSATDISARKPLRPGLMPVALLRDNIVEPTPCVLTKVQGQASVIPDPRVMRNRLSLDGACPLDGGFESSGNPAISAVQSRPYAVTALERSEALRPRLANGFALEYGAQ